MKKTVLVVDEPASCSKCNFGYEFQGIKRRMVEKELEFSGGATWAQ